MSRPCRVSLVAAALLSSMAGPGLAQIAVPDVSAGGRSSVPSLNKQEFAPYGAFRSNQPAPSVNGLAPTTPDPRCRQLTAEQRRLTPGCQ